MAGQLVGSSESGWAVWGGTLDGTGVVGTAGKGIGAYGESVEAYGVFGRSTNAVAVVGDTDSQYSAMWGHNRGKGTGVLGTSDSGGTGVHGSSNAPGSAGVVGENVMPNAQNSVGVRGKATTYGVLGETHEGIGNGVEGRTHEGVGVYGIASAVDGRGVYARSGLGTALQAETDTGMAGVFNGSVDVLGDLTVYNGNKPFKIDHPLDPENKYLLHNAVEAPERKNVYDGVAQLDEDGQAWVDLPEWFEALNGDFRYQLTPVGGAAPNLHVAEEVSENRFEIAGGEEGMRVCWQLTGTRKDPWAAANPFEVEQEKPQEERGHYLQPDLYNAPEEQSVMRARMGEKRQRRMMREEPPQELPQAPEMPPGAPEMLPGFAAPGFFGRLEEQIDELRGQIEELKQRQ